MSVLPILTWPDPRLSQPCAPVAPDFDIAKLSADMLETMYAAPGRGLAAPQVGHMVRLFVMDACWKDGAPEPQIFVNPEITWTSGTTATAGEGCLSLPGLTVDVRRPTEIEVVWRDHIGAAQAGRFDGFAALCIQHEIDHLDGTMTLDRVSNADRDALMATYSAAFGASTHVKGAP